MTARDTPAAESPAPPVQPAWTRRGTVYVMGVDGLSPSVVEPMMREGELPNLARLAAEGAWGPLATVEPTNSSLLWTSIGTGCHHRDHGVDGFRYYTLFGRLMTRSTLRKLKKYGLKLAVKRFESWGWLASHLIDGRHVRRKTFWQILSDAGQRVGVVNWWHTWPASPVNGFIVSDRLFHWRMEATIGRGLPEGHLASPDDLLDEVRTVMTGPDEVTAEDARRFVSLRDDEVAGFLGGDFTRHELRSELRYFIALDATCWRVFEHCIERFPDLSLAVVYFRGTDIAQHAAFQYVPWMQDVAVPEEDRRRYGQAVLETYRVADAHVGKVLARMRPEDALIVLSDHGFGFQSKRGTYGHARGRPPGVLFLYGREFAAGRRIDGADIYDFAPTLLRICGFPPARDMQGSAIEEALTAEFRRANPPQKPIGTYGAPGRGAAPKPSDELDKRIQDHLRGLGYFE